jgi:hypothetical protein
MFQSMERLKKLRGGFDGTSLRRKDLNSPKPLGRRSRKDERSAFCPVRAKT